MAYPALPGGLVLTSQVGIRSPYGVAALHLVYNHPEESAVHHVESHCFVSLVSEPGMIGPAHSAS